MCEISLLFPRGETNKGEKTWETKGKETWQQNNEPAWLSQGEGYSLHWKCPLKVVFAINRFCCHVTGKLGRNQIKIDWKQFLRKSCWATPPCQVASAPLISAAPGAAPGPVHPADCLWKALCLKLALAAMASLSLTVGCWAYPVPCLVHCLCIQVKAQKCP